MIFSLGIAIDAKRIAWVYNSEKRSFSPVRLTTVADGQRKAEINFYLRHRNKKYLIASEVVSGIPVMPAGKPSIDIHYKLKRKTLNYRIMLNNRFVSKNSINLAKYLRSKNKIILSAAALLILAAALLLLFFIKPVFLNKSQKQPEQEVIAKPEPVNAPGSAPKPAADPEPAPESKPEENPEPGSARVTKTTPEPEAETEAATVDNNEQIEVQDEQKEKIEPEQVFQQKEIAESLSVYFDPDSPALTFEAKEKLDSFVAELPSADNFKEGQFKLLVKGHCARYGTEGGRAELSRERAENVYNFLESKWGLDSDNIIIGAGASEPLTLDKNEQHLNRRVEVTVTGDITIATTN